MYIPDNNGDAAGQTDAGGHRGATRRHYQAGDVHPRATRYVHGHGNARRKSGHNYQSFSFLSIVKAIPC